MTPADRIPELPPEVRAAAVRIFLAEIQNPARCPELPQLAQVCQQVVELLPMLGVSVGLMVPAGPLPDDIAVQLYPLCEYLGEIWSMSRGVL